MKHLNIEIKAKCNDHDKIRSILKSRSADFKGRDHQIDIYFKVNSGRLKLREGNIENFLVFYEREDKEGPKQSDVILFKSDPNSSLKEILLKSLGVVVIVDKQREIYFIENVKFHIDTVKNLGTFMEIEAIDSDGTFGKEKLLEQCENYLKLFSIPKDNLISVSYSDLLLEK
ncbi:MAG: class IV adenylate cyclase [Patescibacteria group bacterium]